MDEKINRIISEKYNDETDKFKAPRETPKLLLLTSNNNIGEKKILLIAEQESRESQNDRDIKSNELYYKIQLFFLAISILCLSCHGIYNGAMEYSILENGKKVNGKLPLRKSVITLSLGYSIWYSIVSSLSSCMLLFSLIPTKRYWSIPAIFLCIAELIQEIGDALISIFLLFTRLPFFTALLYNAGTAFVIMGKFWCWLGAVRLYEYQ
ncbi:hypothetical protein HCN44_008498 [Aphidius gifuensis]|uniref:Uncharacterized protein n=1 Tax=Aphidius gifuensis TaxID=684658 RepID=A0A835CNS9_APHGI|nr:uncharacterized protein LOC122858234 isoform X2 [Aphidius gifuensis]KAF7989824.1 hypothetical protein HCN44_008498 [Aphidius gifuensis]